jgi:hypothetical protein
MFLQLLYPDGDGVCRMPSVCSRAVGYVEEQVQGLLGHLRINIQESNLNFKWRRLVIYCNRWMSVQEYGCNVPWWYDAAHL